MVRIIVGTLVKIGSGIFPADCMEGILEARDRSKAGPCAPAPGLTLKSIIEEPPLSGQLVEDNRHWAYTMDYDRIASEGRGFLEIRRSDPKDFQALLLRNTKFLSRNGAKEIYLRDLTGTVKAGDESGYFTWAAAEDGMFVTHDPRGNAVPGGSAIPSEAEGSPSGSES